MIKEVDFFLVGAMKAGTTTLFDGLLKNNQIFMPIEKEPFYYVWSTLDREMVLPANKKKLISYERWKIFDTKDKYKKLFSKCSENQICGEASTFYLPHKSAAEAIKGDNPNARIIIILRNPVDRAYSAYNFQASFSLEPAETFEDAIDQELSGLRDDWLYGWRHIYCGMYYQQVKKYIDTFGCERVLIQLQDDLKSDRQKVMDRCFDFLNVEKIEIDGAQSSNITVLPSNQIGKILHFLFSRPNLVKDSLKKFLPLRYRRIIKNNLMARIAKTGARPAAINPETRVKLTGLFYKDILALENLIGKDLSLWYK